MVQVAAGSSPVTHPKYDQPQPTIGWLVRPGQHSNRNQGVQMSYYPDQGHLMVTRQHRSSTAHIVIAWIVAVLSAGYMLPWAIAATRNKENTLAIAMIDLFLGWSVAGWVAALVMACTPNPIRQTVVVNPYPQAHQPGAVFPSYGPPAKLSPPPSGPEPTLRLPPSYDHPDQPR